MITSVSVGLDLNFKTNDEKIQMLCRLYWDGKEGVDSNNQSYYQFNVSTKDIKDKFGIKGHVGNVHKLLDKYCSAYLIVNLDDVKIPIKLENRTHLNEIFSIIKREG